MQQQRNNDSSESDRDSPNGSVNLKASLGLRSSLNSPTNEGCSSDHGSTDSSIIQSVCSFASFSGSSISAGSDDSADPKTNNKNTSNNNNGNKPKPSKKTLPGEKCKICDEVASGVHFGIFSCEGCKRFFQRASVGAIKKLVCKRGTKNCDVHGAFRTKCKFCRFKRCVQMGMSPSVIQLGRDARKRARQLPQPNPDENLSEMLTNFWSNKDESGNTKIPKKLGAVNRRGVVRPDNFGRNIGNRPRTESTSDESPAVSPSEVKEPRTIPPAVLMASISSEISRTSALLFIYLDYLTKLYQQTKQPIQSQLLNPSTNLANFLTSCADRAIAFVHQLPGIYLQNVLNEELLRNHFLNITSQVIENLCIHALASLPAGSAITPNVFCPDLKPLVEVHLNSEMYKNLRSDIQLRKIDTVGEAIVFTLETLDQLALLEDDAIRTTVAQLKIQTTLLFSQYTSNASYLCSRMF